MIRLRDLYNGARLVNMYRLSMRNVEQAQQRINGLEAHIAAALAIHQKMYGTSYYCYECSSFEENVPYPCPTALALDPTLTGDP